MVFTRGHSAVLAVLFLLTQSAQAFLNKPGTFACVRNAVATSTTQVNLFDIFNEGKKALVKKIAGDYDAAAIRARLDGLIADNPVLMLSFTTCPFCIKAKEVLDAKKTKYTVVELDTDPDGKAMRAEMGDLLGRTSVPAIWIGGQFVGGCNDGPMGGVVKLNDSGELDSLLKGAAAI